MFNTNGTPLSTPVVVQNPAVSGAEGGNTSFFAPGEIIDTSNPPNPAYPATPITPMLPSEPATTTNLSQNLPSFFGTSSASPNVAAVAALMLQLSPGLTSAQIRAVADRVGDPPERDGGGHLGLPRAVSGWLTRSRPSTPPTCSG